MGRDRQMEKGIMLVRRGKKMGAKEGIEMGKGRVGRDMGRKGGRGVDGRKGVLCKRTIKS